MKCCRLRSTASSSNNHNVQIECSALFTIMWGPFIVRYHVGPFERLHYVVLVSEKLVHADLDERALDALKEFPVEGALTVLKQFMDSNLEHVSNKSAYLCGVMKTYRQKSKAQGTSVSSVPQGTEKKTYPMLR